MKILIDTSKKTIKLEEKVKFGKLMDFVKKNNLQDYEIEPEVITVREKEYYPYYPLWPEPNIYPTYRIGDVYSVNNEEIPNPLIEMINTAYLAEVN